MTTTHDPTALPEGPPAALPAHQSFDHALQESQSQGDVTPLRAWARSRGEIAATTGEAKEALVDEILTLAASVDGRLPAHPGGGAGLASALSVAALEGYTEAAGAEQAHPAA